VKVLRRRGGDTETLIEMGCSNWYYSRLFAAEEMLNFKFCTRPRSLS